MPEVSRSEREASLELCPDDSPEGHYVLALLAVEGNTVRASGSAVLVAPYIALTARHVTDDYFKHFHSAEAPQSDYNANYTIFARGRSGGTWRMFFVRRIFNTHGTDIVALYVEPADGADPVSWPRIRLDVRPPQVGSSVYSWGHIGPAATIEGTISPVLGWGANLCRSSGVVRDVYPLERDRSLVNFPSFHFDARVDPSMSGGPVFDSSGNLIGINSTSMAATAEHPIHSSMAALLWPVLALPVSGEHLHTSDRFLDDLCARNDLDVANHELVFVDRSVAASELVVSLRLPVD